MNNKRLQGVPTKLLSVTEAERVALILEGDEAALGELVAAYREMVHLICFAEFRNAQLAEEATGAVFEELYEALPTFPGELSLEVWIRKTAKRVAGRLRKRWGRRAKRLAAEWGVPVPEALYQIADPAQLDPESLLAGREQWTAMVKAWGSLSEQDRKMITMRVDNFSYKEISETFGMPIGTAKSRINRARQQLRRELSVLLGGGL